MSLAPAGPCVFAWPSGRRTGRRSATTGVGVLRATSVVGGVEPAQEWLQVPVRVEGNAPPRAAHPAVTTLRHAIRGWGIRFPMAVLRTEFRTSWGENGSPATAMVSQPMRQGKRKGRRGLPAEGEGTLLAFLVFDRSMPRARAPVEGHRERTLASFAVASPPLWQMLAVDVNQTKIVLWEAPFSLDRSGRDRGDRRWSPSAFRLCPKLSRFKCGRNGVTRKGRSSRAKWVLGCTAQSTGRSSSVAFPGH
jgi:hypothetical protein